MADLNAMHLNRFRKTMIKNSFDSHPYPAGTNRLNAQVGLLTHPACGAFPVCFTSGKECYKHINSSCQESGYTATGIVPDSHRIPFSPFGQQRGFVAPCALQMYVIFSEWQNNFVKYFFSFRAYIYDIKICSFKEAWS